MKVKGQKEGATTDNGLNAAWIMAEEHKLRIATADDWDLAEVSFEKANRELAGAWDKARLLGKSTDTAVPMRRCTNS